MTPIIGGIFPVSKDKTLANELLDTLPNGYQVIEGIGDLSNHSFIAVVDLDSIETSAIRELSERTFVIAVGRDLDNERIIEATVNGAHNVVSRPFHAETLASVMSELQEITREVALSLPVKPPKPTPTCAIVGTSPEIMEVCKKLARLSQVDVPMLITGETGTGKELIAESIAQMSPRFGRPFVVVNCAAVPDNLLESELFGYEKGAFTGATASKEGLLKIADTGTVFFDEIGELPLVLQGKLLRFIQTQTFYALGSTRETRVNVRVISATNRDLSVMVREGKFREDLYHRLRVATIHTPTLRERKNDIEPLMQFFIYRYSHLMNKPIKYVTCAFLARLMTHGWPGNIRELENALRSAIAFSKSPFLTSHDLIELGGAPTPAAGEGNGTGLGAFVSAYLSAGLGKKERNIHKNLHDILDTAIFDYILASQKENISEIARSLGLNRITVRKKLNERHHT